MDRKFKIFSGLLKAYKSDDGVRRLKTTASSTIKDHAKDRMLESAIHEMARTAKDNMTIFLNHRYSVPEDVLGSTEDAVIRQVGSGDDGTIYDLDLDVRVDESNPRAVQTWESLANGTKLGTSIGAIVKDYSKNADGGWDIKSVELLEASIVGIPANPRSWVQYAVKSLEDVTDENDDPQANVLVMRGEPEAETDEETAETDIESEETVETVVLTACNLCDAAKSDDCECTDCSCRKDVSPELVKEESSETTDELTPEASAQEADEAEPEPAKAKALAEPITERDPELVEAIDAMGNLVKEFASLQKRYLEEVASRTKAEQERDQARANLVTAKEIFDRIADLPLARKIHLRAVSEFRSRLSGVYDEDFLKMLENKSHE
jgi:HK97 family phage prohead protease